MPKKVIITGGGTGGHVFPAIAIAEELSRRAYDILYVGSERGMESRLVPKHGLDFVTIESVQVKNKNFFRIIGGLFSLIKSVFVSVNIIRKEKPIAVIGVGGYISVPMAIAAWLSRIPLYLQEQNVSVGIANRFLGRFAKMVFLGFEKAAEYFPKGHSLLTGNPIRKELYRAEPLRIQTNPLNVFIFGGSQGARSVNDAVMNCLLDVLSTHPEAIIIHQTGVPDYDRVKAFYEKHVTNKFEVHPFISDMKTYYENSSMVISRSGALTVSELLAVRRPSLLIPYPRTGQNDQLDNALMLQRFGVAKVVEQGKNFNEHFHEAWAKMLNAQTLENMEENFFPLSNLDALATIADHLEADFKRES